VLINVVYMEIGEQYRWLQKDLAQVDRGVTPWIIALTHPPWYNSYRSHYREAECMRQSMEALLYKFGVDVMFHGHVCPFFLCLIFSLQRLSNLFCDPKEEDLVE